MGGWWSGRVGGGEESDWTTRPLGRHSVFHTPRAIGAPARSGATVFFTHRERLERPLARAPPCFFTHRERLERPLDRAPPCFSHTESDWSARSLGHHRVLHTPRAIGAPARSGATVLFSQRERLKRPSARAPPLFSYMESDWITNPLGRHRVFYTPSALGARVVLGFGVWGWNP